MLSFLQLKWCSHAVFSMTIFQLDGMVMVDLWSVRLLSTNLHKTSTFASFEIAGVVTVICQCAPLHGLIKCYAPKINRTFDFLKWVFWFLLGSFSFRQHVSTFSLCCDRLTGNLTILSDRSGFLFFLTVVRNEYKCCVFLCVCGCLLKCHRCVAGAQTKHPN